MSWRVWSRTSRTGLSSVDLPGPLSWRASTRRLTTAERATRRRRSLRHRAVLIDLLALALAAAAMLRQPGWLLSLLAVAAATAAGAYLYARRADTRARTRSQPS